MKNEVVQHSHFLTEDTDAMYTYIEAIKTLGLKPEVELKLSQSHGHKYVFHVAALKPVQFTSIDFKVEPFIIDSGSIKTLGTNLASYNLGNQK